MSFAPKIRLRGSRQASCGPVSGREGSGKISEGTPTGSNNPGSPRPPLTVFSTKKSRAQQVWRRSRETASQSTEDAAEQHSEPDQDEKQVDPAASDSGLFDGESIDTKSHSSFSQPEVQQVAKNDTEHGRLRDEGPGSKIGRNALLGDLFELFTSMLMGFSPALELLQAFNTALDHTEDQKDMLGVVAALMVALHNDTQQQARRQSQQAKQRQWQVWIFATVAACCAVLYTILPASDMPRFVPV